MMTPFLTVDCVLFHFEKVLLIRRRFKPYKDCYALPGGFVDIGENVEEACIREVKEETSIKVDKKTLKLVGVYSNPNRDPRAHTVSIAFLGHSKFEVINAGDDATSVEFVENWRNLDIAFDHGSIIDDAWDLQLNILGKK
jgi:8-oxo-dGTP diphosphatase